MELEYNGVSLELLSIDRADRVGVYTPDGADLLYVKWVLSATCVYAPSPGYPVATAASALSPDTEARLYDRAPPPPPLFSREQVRGTDPSIPPFTQVTNVGYDRTDPRWLTDANRPGRFNAVMTDAELRARLWVPRARLKITAHDANGREVVWLQSPKPGLSVDVANGPHPISVDVVEAAGSGHSMGVHFQIETSVSPCPSGSDRLILSHRWEMAHDHDDDYYLTRYIQGEVVFNAEILDKLDIWGDHVRNQFFHPIPLGFRRGGPKLVQSSDGLVIRYTIRDTDQTVTFEPGDSGATHVEIAEKIGFNQTMSVGGSL